MILRLRQLARVLMLLAFVGGGGGIPAIDAVIYHHANPADSPQGVHVEPLGAACHTDTCLTGLSVLVGVDLVPPALGRLIAPVDLASALGANATDGGDGHQSGPGLPRAPPES